MGEESVPVSVEKTEEAVCKVCGQPPGDRPVVLCGICEAPYHRDCWDYQGRCSIYGCGSRAYRDPAGAESGSGRLMPIEIPVQDLSMRTIIPCTMAMGLAMALCAVLAIVASHTGNLILFELMSMVALPFCVALGVAGAAASRSVLVLDRAERRAMLRLRLMGMSLLELPPFRLGERPELTIEPDGDGRFVARFDPGRGAEYVGTGVRKPLPVTVAARLDPDTQEGIQAIARVHRLADEIGCSLRIPSDRRFGDSLRLLTPPERQVRAISATSDKKPGGGDPDDR